MGLSEREALEDGSFQTGKDDELDLFLPVLRLWFLSTRSQRRVETCWEVKEDKNKHNIHEIKHYGC